MARRMEDVSTMIRRADEADLRTIVDLKLRMFEEAGMAGLLAEDAYQRVLRHYHLLYLAGSAVHFLMEVEGQIVACSGAFLKDDLPYCFYRQPTYGFLGDVYTRPAYRRQGYARQLTTKAIDWLNGRGVEMIRLLATPPAQALYVKLGFEPSGEMILRLNHP
jgi:GNAT superfamily N-acetyltransferase